MRAIASMSVLLLALLSAGCSGHKHTPKDEHEHEHGEGPHNGEVFDWGKLHLEFTVNHDKAEVRIYVLGKDAKAAPIKTEKLTLKINEPAFEIELRPEQQKGDPDGTASCFVGTDKRFGKEQEFAGTVTGLLDGNEVKGNFAEKPEHDHDRK